MSCRLAQLSVRRRGFTLIEILVVISIIAILSSLVIGGVMTIQDKAKESSAKLEVKQLDEQLANYLFEEKIYPAAAKEADICLLYTSPSPRDATLSRMPSSA